MERFFGKREGYNPIPVEIVPTINSKAAPKTNPKTNSKTDSDNITEIQVFEQFVKLCEQYYTTGSCSIDKEIFQGFDEKTIKKFLDHHFNAIINNHKIVNVILILCPYTILTISKSNKFMTLFPNIKQNLDSTVVDASGNNFLYNIKAFDGAMTILKSNYKFDVNHKSNPSFILTNIDNQTTETMMKFVEALASRKYLFRDISPYGYSVFSIAYKYNENGYTMDHNIIKKILEIPEIDPSVDLKWLKYYTSSYCRKDTCHFSWLNSFMYLILEKDNYETFLINSIDTLPVILTEDDYILIVSIFLNLDDNKAKNMIMYQDKRNDTFVHWIAGYHYDKLLNFISRYITMEDLKPNNNGYTVFDVYNKKSTKNILKKSIVKKDSESEN